MSKSRLGNEMHRNIGVTYCFEFGKNMGFTQAIWVTYLAYKGLTLVEIGLCESVFHLTSMVMELPTGMIADLYGRKISRLLGIVDNLIYLFLLIFVDNVAMAFVAFVFAALSYNLESGADTALIYDSLLVNNVTETFTKIQGRREVILQSASLIGVVVGGVLADIDYNLAIFASIGLAVVVFGVGTRFTEAPYPKDQSKFTKAFANQFMKPWKMVKEQPELVFHMVLVAVVLSAVTTTHYYATAYFKSQGFSLTLISIFLVLQAIGAITGGLVADRLKVRFNEELLFGVFPFLIAVAVAMIPTPLFVVSLFLMGLADSVLYVVLTNLINHRISSDQRATILSLNSMFFSIVMIVLFPVFGMFGDRFGLDRSFYVLAFLIGIVALLNRMKIRTKR